MTGCVCTFLVENLYKPAEFLRSKDIRISINGMKDKKDIYRSLVIDEGHAGFFKRSLLEFS